MKRNTISTIEDTLKEFGVPEKVVPSLAADLYKVLFPDYHKPVPSGEILRVLEEAKELNKIKSYRQLSKELGVTPNYFHTLRYVKGDMVYEIAKRACGAVGVDVDELLAKAEKVS